MCLTPGKLGFAEGRTRHSRAAPQQWHASRPRATFQLQFFGHCFSIPAPRKGWQEVESKRMRKEQWGYRLADGTIVEVPSAPILKAGILLPGWVVKPDGKRVYVFQLDENADIQPNHV